MIYMRGILLYRIDMTASKQLPIRIPGPLRVRLDRFAEQSGQPLAAVIRSALNDYLAQRNY